MEAIRQFVTVKNRQVTINLPDDFAAEEVEVIIIRNENNFPLSDSMKSILDNRIEEPESEYISAQDSLDRIKKKYGF